MTLQRYYSKFSERSTGFYNPVTCGYWSEVSGVHAAIDTLEALLSVCDTQVVYTLPKEDGSFFSDSDVYSISGIQVQKYLKKRMSFQVIYQGKKVNVYPVDTWFTVPQGTLLKDVIKGYRLVQSVVEENFQPAKVTYQKQEKLPIPLLATPSQYGIDLLKRSLPYGKTYEPLDDHILQIITENTTQGRIETFYHGEDTIEKLYDYDGRWTYSSCLRHVPVGSVTHDTVNALLPYVPGFYRAKVTVPASWSHIGLLPMRNPLGSSTKFSYPRYPGETFETFCTSEELALAVKHHWHVQILERILWCETDKQPEALKLFGDRLIRIRQETSLNYPEPYRTMIKDATRKILLETVGSFHRTIQEYDGYTSDPRAIPEESTLIELIEGDIWHYAVPSAITPLQKATVHPEWSGFIWGKARKKLAEAALTIPFKKLVALRVDAIWCAEEASFTDTGKVGQFVRKPLANDCDLQWPKDTADMLDILKIVRV